MAFDHSENGLKDAPAAEDAPIEDEVVEDEVVEDEVEGDEPEADDVLPDTDEVPEPEPDAWEARVEAWGGEDKIEDAVAIANALATEDGIEALVREGAKALGWDADAVVAAGQGKKATTKDEDDYSDDEPITRKEAREMADARAQEVQKQLQSQSEAVIRNRVEAALENLGVADDDEARVAVLNFAARHASVEEQDPERLVAAVRKGYEDFQSWTANAAQKYVEKRAAKNAKVPKRTRAAGVPAADEVKPPANMDEAKAAARRMFKEQGIMQ